MYIVQDLVTTQSHARTPRARATAVTLRRRSRPVPTSELAGNERVTVELLDPLLTDRIYVHVYAYTQMYADRQHTRKSFIISSFTHLHQPSSERANRTKRCRAWWRTPPAPLASFCSRSSRNSAMSDSTSGAVRSGHGRLGLGCILVRCINVHLPVWGQGQGHFYVVFQQPHSTSCPFMICNSASR